MDKSLGKLTVASIAGLLLVMGCAGAPSTSWSGGPGHRSPITHRNAAEYLSQRGRPGGRAELPVLDDNAMLPDYLTYAALNNPGLEATYERWQAALEKIPQARALPDPRLSYGHFIHEVETRVGPQENKVGLSQTFPWFGKLDLRGRVVWEEAEAARERYEAEKLKLFFHIKEAYYEYYYVARARAVVAEMRGLMKQLEQVARVRYMVAAAGHPDVIRAQVEFSKLEDRLRTLEELRGPISARLNAALNRRITAELPWPTKLPSGDAAVDEGRVLEALKKANPELRVFAHEIAREEHAIALAKKDYYPDVTLGVDYVDTGGARMPGVAGSGKDPLIAIISINLPLWRGKLAAGVREAEAKRRAVDRTRAERENALAAEVKLALYRFSDAERKIGLYRDTLLPMAQQSLAANRKAFEAGQAGFTDVLDAERVLLEFELSLERARADRATELARLEMLVGTELTARPGATDAEK